MNNIGKEFIKTNFPESINHPVHGLGHVEVKEYEGKCVAQYRHENNTCSLASIGANWNEVYDEMIKIDFSKYITE